MIGWLQGQIIDKPQPGKLVLNVQGVGYDVETSLNTFFKAEALLQTISLHIHTIVREDALLLYGFLDKEERALFRSLIKVNGIGPKSAIAILSSTTPNEFIQCIAEGNTAFLTKLPGIGKKTAERLVVEMRDNLSQLSTDGLKSLTLPVSAKSNQDDAASALESLGYKPSEIVKVMKKIDDGCKSSEQLIRDALQFFNSALA